MNHVKCLLPLLALALTSQMVRADEAQIIPAPPQDQGLPYTRSAHSVAMAKIKDEIAVFAGSRYAYVKGFRVRLDQNDVRHGEAALQDGQILVPAAFAAVLDMPKIDPPPAPDYMKDRWVYELTLPEAKTADTVTVDGKPYVALAKLAAAKGLKVYQNPRGLLLIGGRDITFAETESTLLDSVITMFDTPDKLADPDIATKYVPTLAIQGKWTDHIKVTPEQLAILNGPETKWPTEPKSNYDLTGFNTALLGSPVPPPGVYPRVLFSPEDVPMLAKRVKSSKFGQQDLIEMEYLFKHSWWDPATSDGQIFDKLAGGDTAGLEWDVPPGTSPTSYPATFKGQKPGIHNSHISYIPECLTDMALYCLLTNDDEHGQKAANAIVTYYKMREPIVDQINAISDSEFGSSLKLPDGSIAPMNGNGAETTWRSMQGAVAHMNLGLSLDFAGKWMNADQKETMRRIIVKATYGRRPYGQDGSVRFRDVNWVAWDLTPFLALAAIEGLPGFDREAYESDCETVRAFCDWGIDDSGVIYESDGKNPGSLQFQTLSMITLARRGENLWGHPHWRKLLTGQVESTSPNGRVTVNSGTQYSPFSRQLMSYQFIDELRSFYPDDKRADYLLGRAKIFGGAADEGMREWMPENFDADAYRANMPKLAKERLRLPSPTYPGFVHGVLYDSDFEPATRADLDVPLDFSAPAHGLFSSYSDKTPDATWIHMLVRPDHYIGAGHHHADAGMFHFSALGVDWFTQTQFDQSFEGKYFNLVQVDGHSEADRLPGLSNVYNGAATYLGAVIKPLATAAGADLTYAYTYRWMTQPPAVWSPEEKALPWEMDPTPRIMNMFAGTAHYKMRFWWADYNFSNYIATSRAPFNPMQYVFRTTGLVRGAHPYGFVIDDLKKDDQSHLYQWAGMLNGGVWKAGVANLAPNQAVLAYRAPDAKATDEAVVGQPAVAPQPGEPLLLVTALTPEPDAGASAPMIDIVTENGPPDRKGVAEPYDRLVINHHGTDAAYKVLLIPFRAGEDLPKISFDASAKIATVSWKDQKDQFAFTANSNSSTHLVISRDGTTLLESK